MTEVQQTILKLRLKEQVHVGFVIGRSAIVYLQINTQVYTSNRHFYILGIDVSMKRFKITSGIEENYKHTLKRFAYFICEFIQFT